MAKKNTDLFVTGADLLVDIVREKKKVLVSFAAKKLGVSSEVAEDWAVFNQEAGGELKIQNLRGKKYIFIE